MFLKRPMCNSEEDLKAKYEIKELLEFERFSRDNSLWDEMRKCYLKDAHVSVSWFQGTADEFITASEQISGSYVPHRIYNTQIWINGKRAVAIMMATIQLRRVLDGVEYQVDSDVKIATGLVQQDGQWYIASFDCIYDKDEMKSVVPAQTMNISRDELQQYRESYASLSYITDKTGMKLSQEMIGRDRPETIDELYKRLENWLYE